MRSEARKLPRVVRDGMHTRTAAENGDYVLHEWALGRDDDVDDLDLVKLANPASWQTVERLRARHDSPSMLPWQWARFACGIWMASEHWWVTGEQWREAEQDGIALPGDTVTLTYVRGSDTHDVQITLQAG